MTATHEISVKVDLQALDSNQEMWRGLEELENIEDVEISELIQ